MADFPAGMSPKDRARLVQILMEIEASQPPIPQVIGAQRVPGRQQSGGGGGALGALGALGAYGAKQGFGSLMGGSSAASALPSTSMGISALDPALLYQGPELGSLVGGASPSFSLGTAYSPEAISSVGAPAEASSAGLGSYLLPAAGAYGMYDLFSNKRKGARGAIQGAASGAAIGSLGGPLGIGIGAGVGLGAGLIGGVMNRKSTKEIEADRWKELGKSDIGNSRKGQDYFAGTPGIQSRDEKYLTADAIRVNPDNYNNIPDWDTWPKALQDAFLNAMLSEGKVREKKGGIYYDDDRAKEVASQIKAGTYKAPPIDTKPRLTMANLAAQVGKPIAVPSGGDMSPESSAAMAALKPMQRPVVSNGGIDLKKYPPGYRGVGPDGLNQISVDKDGNVLSTLIGVPKPGTELESLKGIAGQLNNGQNFSSNVPQQIMIPKRSKTLSPGIGLDGKPYNYGKR